MGSVVKPTAHTAEGLFIKKFGIEFPNFLDLDGYTVATRSVFIIDEQGIIRYKWLADNPGQEPNYEEIDSQLASMN